MTKRLLIVIFVFLLATCLAKKSLAQRLPAHLSQPQQAQAELEQFASIRADLPQSAAASQTAEQQSPQPTPTPAADKATSSAPRKDTVGSATLGNENSSPLSVKGKLHYFAVESFRPGIYPVAAFYTGLTMASPPKAYPREWRQGLPAFGRNYGDFMASWVAVQGGKFTVAALTHEDPRYFPSRSKNFFARCFNAARYAVIDRGDNGNPRLALANIGGALSGGFVGNAYLPDPYANASHALTRSALGLSGFATSNLADEFRPEIHKVLKKLHLPQLGY